MKSLYYSFIYSYLSYCVELSGSAPKKYTDTIYKLQKRCCKLILNVPRRTPSSQLFKDCNVLSFQNVFCYHVILFASRYFFNELPGMFNDMFKKKESIINTRNDHFMYLPLLRTQLGQNSLQYQGPKLWNEHAKNIDYNCSPKAFKRRIHKYFLNVQCHM